MRQVVGAGVRALLLVVSVLVASVAFGQPEQPASRTIYFGSVLNPSTVSAAAAAAQPRESVILDLTLYDDGFAYGKLILPRRGLVVAATLPRVAPRAR